MDGMLGMDLRDLPDHQVHQDNQGYQVHQDNQVHQVSKKLPFFPCSEKWRTLCLCETHQFLLNKYWLTDLNN